jgi:hypothetical protein
LDFLGAMGLEKGHGQGARFTNFDTHPTSRSGLAGDEEEKMGAYHAFRFPGHVV